MENSMEKNNDSFEERFKNPGKGYAIFPIIHSGIVGNPANAQRSYF